MTLTKRMGQECASFLTWATDEKLVDTFLELVSSGEKNNWSQRLSSELKALSLNGMRLITGHTGCVDICFQSFRVDYISPVCRWWLEPWTSSTDQQENESRKLGTEPYVVPTFKGQGDAEVTKRF